ncbi:MAG TPA: phosphoenolpyruvate--protein phosphotransferase [Planctomycetota bacterium]|nr:phosphoenolpyruvate--protein phosphotransferase [Planctomycetota bacterium]
MLEGLPVCAGVAIGPVRFRGFDLDRPLPLRLPTTRVESEVERFRSAVRRSIEQVGKVKQELASGLGADEARILDVHAAYLEDPTFFQDVENRIRNDQLALEDALARAVRDFDRIFELVESEHMKERALDLRDVALRVIRNVQGPASEDGASSRAGADDDGPYVIAAHKLSLTDLVDLEHGRVVGIIAEQGGPSSHAGILARSLGIPAITGVANLREHFRDGDFVIVDAGTGIVHVNPDERLRREYEVHVTTVKMLVALADVGPAALSDGEGIIVLGACGNLGEVTQARDAGFEGVGIYRTELLYLLERDTPTEELLLHHYEQVHERIGRDVRVVFRLLDLTRLQRQPSDDEPNPVLGLRGVRGLLSEPELLRAQLRALLRASPESTLEVAVPFVSTMQDVRRIHEVVRSERAMLMKEGVTCAHDVKVGAIVEVPAVAFHMAGVANEVDFLVVALDSLQQYLLAADRDNLLVQDYYQGFHPALFRLLAQLVVDAKRLQTELMLFGEAAVNGLRLPFLLGVGYREFAISPVRAGGLRRALEKWSVAETQELARRVLACQTSLDVQRCLLEAER